MPANCCAARGQVVSRKRRRLKGYSEPWIRPFFAPVHGPDGPRGREKRVLFNKFGHLTALCCAFGAGITGYDSFGILVGLFGATVAYVVVLSFLTKNRFIR